MPMWQIKAFKTREEMIHFINTHNIQYNEIYVSNIAYAIEYRLLKEV